MQRQGRGGRGTCPVPPQVSLAKEALEATNALFGKLQRAQGLEPRSLSDVTSGQARGLAVSMQNKAVSLAMLMKACDRVGSALARDVLL